MAPLTMDRSASSLAAIGAVDDGAVAALTSAIVAGDRNAYERLFRLRCAFVERETQRRLRRRHDLAENAAQEVWIRAARAPVRCPTVAQLDAWLRRLVASAVIDLLRSELARRAREETIASSRPEAASFVDDIELLDEIRADLSGLDGLAPEARALLELRARTGATLVQLAAMLGLTRAGVDSRLRRAAIAARAALGASDAERCSP